MLLLLKSKPGRIFLNLVFHGEGKPLRWSSVNDREALILLLLLLLKELGALEGEKDFLFTILV